MSAELTGCEQVSMLICQYLLCKKSCGVWESFTAFVWGSGDLGYIFLMFTEQQGKMHLHLLFVVLHVCSVFC